MTKALAGAMAGMLLAAGCMGEDKGARSALVEHDEMQAAAVRITGVTPAQRRALRSILAGMGRARIDRIEFSEADRDWPDGELMLFRIDRKDLRAEWEAHLVGGVFRDRSLRDRLPKGLGGGGRVRREQCRTREARSALSPLRNDDADDVLAGIEGAARKSGAELDRVELLEPDGLDVAARSRH